jgi:hemerythrin
MAIEWNERLATGNCNIDDQHKELFRRFDTLLAACNQRKGKDEVYNLLLFLGDYVKTHFSMEETLQKNHNYPHYPAHKKEHEGFIQELRRLEEQLQLEGASLPLVIQTNQTMVSWLINHINRMDKEMASYLRSTSKGG